MIPTRIPGARRPVNVYSGDVPQPRITQLRDLGLPEGMGNLVDSDEVRSPNTEETNRFYTAPTTLHDYQQVANGTNANKQLGFTARSVRISNWSVQFAWIECIGSWIAPYQVDCVFQIPSGTQNGKVSWEAPPGVSQPAANTSEVISLTWVQDFLMPSPGLILKSPTLP